MSTLILILVILTGAANLLAILILVSLWREAIRDLLRRIIAGLGARLAIRRVAKTAARNAILEDYANKLNSWNRGERE